MPHRPRLYAAALLGVAAVGVAALVWVTPRVFAGSAGDARGVNGVSLINNATRTPILGLSPVTDGTVVDLTRLTGTRLSLRADLAAGVDAGSVVFTLTGAKGDSLRRTESRAPFFLCDDYVDCPLLATPDAYTLTAQAYTGTRAGGAAVGVPFSVRFSVTDRASATRPVDVLFVGNSLLGTVNHVTREDTPTLLHRLAAAEGRTVRLTKVIHFGYTLRHTWEDGFAAKALSGSGRYDVIVLQEYSTLVATSLPTATSTLLNLYAPTFARILKPGGRVVLFKNWALVNPDPFDSRAEAKAAIDANYAALSAALTTPNLVAPIGDEFETVIAAHGPSFLIVPDGKHPNDTAVYLDAVTLYGILFHESPRGLADAYLNAPVAAYLRSVAATAIGY
ncbi:hypothetical protein [Hamadaea tsunoensis]|uniref:hypothetical protein n=1 Tax=Hamadaea tsunoensis TaxID=53368 RepID=UPI00040D141E|nr:hypothetical protein [Hamadaea tsunoensis]